ncbi:curli-like amyloid fiber formation chaperone CsgH [Roseicyclus marinus]|uniref:curli-like amyloid fiber formation chaperone CsgH n=1 Tax=Roseicyclus marinus TaxID=2161673 RepID=UPI00240F72F0|nr:curli-like amyloid fiber formation chaperone CsgH [Roseicyclus marinus]MDG3041329.1 curli-like amyloid fiber formation chaperone CsgH [Roseicyclus marinus]
MTLTPSSFALGGSLAALALGCTALAGNPDRSALPVGPMSCHVETVARGASLTVTGHVTATEDIAGDYHLRVAQGGVLMNQSGDFALRAGETAQLGQVTLNGPAAGLEVDLTLETGGRRLHCPEET